MSRNVLIAGTDDLIASHLAASFAVSEVDSIFYVVQPTETSVEEVAELTQSIVDQIISGSSREGVEENAKHRLHVIAGDYGSNDLGLQNALRSRVTIDCAWYVSGGYHPVEYPIRTGADLIKGLTVALQEMGATELNVVCPIDVFAASDLEQASGLNDTARPFGWFEDSDITEQCDAHNLGYRIFHISSVVGHSHTLLDVARNDFVSFLAVLHELKNEIEQRLHEYFQFYALRYWTPEKGTLNLIAVDQAVELMLKIAQSTQTLGGNYCISSPEATSFTDLCLALEEVYDMGILPVQDREELNAVDEIFNQRLERARTYLTAPQSLPWEQTYRAAGVVREQGLFEGEAMLKALRTVRERQDAAWVARDRRVASLPARLDRKTIDRNGSELTYLTGGSGEVPVVFINALGYELDYWYRLMENLIRRYRIVAWELRGTVDPPHRFQLIEQVDDLDAILRHEAIEKCHFIAWCTGAKIALQFHRRSPETVSSMAFINSALKCFASPEDLISDYERNLEPLCRNLDRCPAIASSVMRSLQAITAENGASILDESDRREAANRVLSLTNMHLRQHLLGPFRTEAATVNYARQALDFWDYDINGDAQTVQVPVLLIGSECDKVVSPAMSRAAAQLFPQGRYVEVRGGTHYSFYDCPDVIANLIKDFFRDSSQGLELSRSSDLAPIGIAAPSV
jgi:pimeloyl-ACP methyl ester carboxylesterase